jgi:hypothetical protein
MWTYEYKVLVMPASSYEVDEEVLNIHGAKGWELVSVVVDEARHRLCYLRRRSVGRGTRNQATA